MGANVVEDREFYSSNTTTLYVHMPVGRHGENDMMEEFLMIITSEDIWSRSNADTSVGSHPAALAAEESRLLGGEPIFIQEKYKKI